MTLTRAWLALILLSLAASAMALVPSSPWGGAVVLGLCYAKGRLVLDHYLGLARAPAWRRAFAWGYGGFLMLCLALYLWPAFGT